MMKIRDPNVFGPVQPPPRRCRNPAEVTGKGTINQDTTDRERRDGAERDLFSEDPKYGGGTTEGTINRRRHEDSVRRTSPQKKKSRWL